MSLDMGPTYHHGKSQWFVRGAIPTGAEGAGFVYGSDVKVFPKEPQKANPVNLLPTSSMNEKHYHVANLHQRDFETAVVNTNDTWPRENNRRRQHFVAGQVAGGSTANSLVYGTDELLRREAEKNAQQAENFHKRRPAGLMYGTDAATHVGQPKAGTRPNNALMLEERTEKDTRRFQKLAFDKDEFLMRHYDAKAQQKAKEHEEKRKDLEMLQSYEPWGKPGGGAPRLKSEDVPDTHILGAMAQVKAEPYVPFGGRGGGAPNRTDSGKVVTTLRADPELRFPKHALKAEVVPSLRYVQKNTGYGKELDAIVGDSKTRKEMMRQRSFEEELRHISHDPFGRPGGGAPVRNPRGSVQAGFPTTLSKHIEELRKVEPRHGHAYNPGPIVGENQASPRNDAGLYDPWGRGHGNPNRTESGKLAKTLRNSEDNDLDGLGIQIGRPGAGAPNKDENGNLRVRKPQTLSKTQTGQSFPREFSARGGDTYNPFGKPGAGAPIKDQQGNILTQTAGKVEHAVLGYSPKGARGAHAKQEYLKTLQSMTEQAKQQRRMEQDELMTGGKDVASWLRSGVIGKPQFDPVTKEIRASHKATSDVTSQKLNIRRQRNEQSVNYHHDLELLAEERHQQRRREREAEQWQTQKHVDTMNNLWGRPGGGAPLSKDDAVQARKQRLGLDPTDQVYKYRDF